MNGAFDSAGDISRRFREGDRLAQENDLLRARLSALSLYEERIGLLEDEVENMRSLSKLNPLPGHERVAADVVGFAQYEGRITLSVGQEKGILPNMPVICADGLVAIVQTTWKGGCQAELITNVGVQVGGLDLSRKPATEGILRGRDPSTLVLTFFDPNAPAKPGDVVVTSGHSDRIPRLLNIGKIISVEDDVDYGIRRATVVPFMNPGLLKEVQILK
jgi:rod shape-determining protein MreC